MWIARQLHDVLSGRLPLEEADPSVQSMCRHYFYEGAAEILALPTKAARIEALARIPERVRPHVEKECWRVWRLRQGQPKL